MLKTRVFTLLAVFLPLCFVCTMDVLRAEHVVGVKGGDWIRYDITVTIQEQSVTGSIKITVDNVTGTFIQGIYEVNVQGYSVLQPTPFTLDVSTGIGGYASGFLIPANLTVGQPIPGEGARVETIVDWQGRKAIAANATAPFMGFAGQIYWDQATGVLLESSGSAVGTTYKISVIETSLWSGGLFGSGLLTWIVIIVVVVAVAVAVGLILCKRKVQAAHTVALQGQPTPPPPP